MVTQLITFSFYGNTKNVWLSPHLLTRSLLAQKILLSIRKKWMGSFEIGTEIGADKDYVMDELSWLSKNALVKKTNKNQWIADIIILDREEKEALVDLAKQLSQEEALKIKGELPKLKATFEKCSFQGQGFSWAQMDYIILAALIADLGVNYSLHRKGIAPPPPKRPDGGKWYFWGLEGGANSKRQFGVNSNSIKGGGTAHIWSWLVKKPATSPFEDDEIALMLALANRSLKVSEIAEVTHLSLEIVEQKMKKISTHGYFAEIKGTFKPNFPIFTRKDIEIMIAEIIRISDSIVDNILKPKETVFQQLFEKMELTKLNREYGAYLCMLYHMIMDHVLDKLVENHILPEMPEKAPVTWGFWGWVRELKLFEKLASP